jgi:hypothetical protein
MEKFGASNPLLADSSPMMDELLLELELSLLQAITATANKTNGKRNRSLLLLMLVCGCSDRPIIDFPFKVSSVVNHLQN